LVFIAIADFGHEYPEGDDVAFVIEQIRFGSLPFCDANLQSQQQTKEFYNRFRPWSNLALL